MVNQVLTLELAYLNTVEGDVVVDGSGIADQAVVRDDLDASGMGFVSCSGSCGGILRADHDDLDASRDQRFNVGFFFGGITLAEEDLYVVPGSGEGVIETGLILDPAGLILGGEHHTD